MLWSNKIYTAPPNSGNVLLGRTLPSLLDEACDRAPNFHALNWWTEQGWQSLSERAFRTAAEEVALGLSNLGLEKGDRVALLMQSDVNFCIVDMGCLLAQLIDVPIDLTQTLENIVFITQHSEAKGLIVSNLDLLDHIIPYLSSTPDLQIAIVADVPLDWQGQSKHPQSLQIFSLAEIRQRGQAQMSDERQQQLRASLTANDLATIIYIPGATGKPQGVMLTHENLSANALAMFSGIPDLELGAKEVVLSFLPLTHVFARVFFYGHMNYGHSVYFTTPNRVMKHLKEVQPTIFATVPLLLEKIYQRILETGSQTPQPETAKSVKYDLLPRFRTFAAQMFQKKQETPQQKFRLSSLRWLPPTQFKLPHWQASLTAWKSLQTEQTQRLVDWAIALAQQYELGRSPSGKYDWMLKLANRLVFSRWRSVFGGHLKYAICGGAALKAEIANLFAAARVTILQGYGLTETSSAVACNRGSFNRAGTVGVPLPGIEIAIASDGEILVRGPYVTQGYYKNPEATQQAIDSEGWFHTGDIGEFTADGFLKIVGLKKSHFKLSTGKYVTPQPLEHKLEQSPLVAKAVAVGAERKFCAMLIFPDFNNLRQQAQLLELDLPDAELLNHPCILALYQALVDEANCHLPYWSLVKRFQLINATLSVENGMLTPSGEVKRARIAEMFAQEINTLYGQEDSKRRETQRHEQLNLCPPVPSSTCPAYAQSLSQGVERIRNSEFGIRN
ncbi:long-chain fatty acid--CoA ligase [Cyanosarcina cf. burmensis CCALA 770]|nr:long-chain fatty acid--CoA ligase [Cyanosarcina cf. burmensis CCALA 770]